MFGRRSSFAAGIMMSALALAAPQAPAADGDAWQFSLTPYLWLPSIGGSMSFGIPPGGSGSPDASVGSGNYLDNLKAAFMLSGEARRGDWGLVGDFIYLDFKNEQSKVTSVSGPAGVVEIPLNAGTSSNLSGTLLTLAMAFSFLRNGDGYVDALAGFRHVGIDAQLNWNFSIPPTLISRSGSIAADADLWDGVIGARARINFGSGNQWFVPGYLDLGGGSSRFTWQGMVGIGYAFGWGELLLAHRYFSIEQNADKLIQRVYFSGPALAASFRF